MEASSPETGPDPVIEFLMKEVDLTLLRENLRLTPHERMLNLVELQKFAEELRRAGEDKSTGSGGCC